MICLIDIHAITMQRYKKNSYSFAFLSLFRIFADNSNKEQIKKTLKISKISFKISKNSIKICKKCTFGLPDDGFLIKLLIFAQKPKVNNLLKQ